MHGQAQEGGAASPRTPRFPWIPHSPGQAALPHLLPGLHPIPREPRPSWGLQSPPHRIPQALLSPGVSHPDTAPPGSRTQRFHPFPPRAPHTRWMPHPRISPLPGYCVPGTEFCSDTESLPAPPPPPAPPGHRIPSLPPAARPDRAARPSRWPDSKVKAKPLGPHRDGDGGRETPRSSRWKPGLLPPGRCHGTAAALRDRRSPAAPRRRRHRYHQCQPEFQPLSSFQSVTCATST
ncbi:basic proline-rich protein-like isoform X3 [Motacilla alba alba]|uniref:basic proline-rich protein-like isoform X3 n=1 Tax=Motacilla alba alba TaxID=1094192 RepID=UPI0018D568A3|nr:basic proline-rich protein-like isoform X3 [Motacilla alba alba]